MSEVTPLDELGAYRRLGRNAGVAAVVGLVGLVLWALVGSIGAGPWSAAALVLVACGAVGHWHAGRICARATKLRPRRSLNRRAVTAGAAASALVIAVVRVVADEDHFIFAMTAGASAAFTYLSLLGSSAT